MSGLFDKFKASPKPQNAAPPPPLSPLAARTTATAAQSSTAMSDDMFRKMRDFVYAQSGIYFVDAKKYLLEGRIAKRVEALKVAGFEEYYSYISSPLNRKQELPALFEAITINETYFFRNEPQFQALESIILPEIIKKKMDSPVKKLRLWSAASSSGEEAYTLAMIIAEQFKPRYPTMQVEIVGTDISPAVIAKAQQGVYQEYAVRNIPQNYLRKYFTRDTRGGYVLAPEIRSMVSFTRLNLYDTAAMRAMHLFDVIFCCNVLIYFDAQSKQQVVSHLYDGLNNGGYLFIGYSESLHSISKAFRIVHFPKTIAYKKD